MESYNLILRKFWTEMYDASKDIRESSIREQLNFLEEKANIISIQVVSDFIDLDEAERNEAINNLLDVNLEQFVKEFD